MDATVRDQRPLKFLRERIAEGETVQSFLDELNSRVFFHVSEDRLKRLLGARAYRARPHDVLTIDTLTFLDEHPTIDLTAYNTGSVHLRTMPVRSSKMFIPIEEYDWEAWRRKRGRENAVVELTVPGSASVMSSTLSVECWYRGEVVEELYP